MSVLGHGDISVLGVLYEKKDADVETHPSALPPIYDLKSTKPFAILSLHSV